MAYSRSLAVAYAKNRNRYRSSDGKMAPLLSRVGVKGKNILDFGCGDGSEAERFIEQKAKKIVGVDSSATMIKLAKARKLPRSIFLMTDGKTLPLKNEEFDLVFSRFVLHYIRNTKSQFREIARVAKKGGYFLAIFQCLTNKPKSVNKKVPINLGSGKNVTKITILSKSIRQIRNHLNDAGFEIVKSLKVKNTDARIAPTYKNSQHFKNATWIIFAQKIR